MRHVQGSYCTSDMAFQGFELFNGFFDPVLRKFPLIDGNREQPVIPGEDFLMYCLHRDQSLVQGTLKVVLRLVSHIHEVLPETSNEFWIEASLDLLFQALAHPLKNAFAWTDETELWGELPFISEHSRYVFFKYDFA